MFCQECGKKNVKGAKYCEDCGAKLVANTTKEKKTINKKTKVVVGTILIVFILVAICLGFLANKFKPQNIAKDYFLATFSGNADKLYDYLNVDNSSFTSKKVFKNACNLPKQDIVNYSVDKVTNDKLTSEVIIKYTKKNSKDIDTFTVNLVKNKKKKFLVFDNWEITNENSIVIKDVVIKAPKKSSVSFEGITLNKKYLDSSDDAYDKYIIPNMFKGKYETVITLKNGLKLENSFNIDSSNVDLTGLNISKEEQAKIKKSIPDLVNSLYKNAIEKKAFDDIKKEYDYDGADLSGLKTEYEYISSGANYSGLTKFAVLDVKINNAKLDGSYISASAKINYEYTVSKTWLGEERNNTKKLNDTIYLDFDYVKGKYKLVNISSFPKYFSLF